MHDEENSDDDLMPIIDDVSEVPQQSAPLSSWRVLIVDDDPEVHQATILALKDLIIEHKPLELLHAYSAAEAERLLSKEQDIGVVLLDVVMETDSAGLDLVEVIREKLNLVAIRIILRTGQPGYAPEMETIQRYDINDYRTKPELTRIRLFTILTSALRAYKQICNQKAMRKGLEKVVNASTELANYHGLRVFAEGVVRQISTIIQIETDGLICVQENENSGDSMAQIIAAAGRYSQFVQSPLASLDSPKIRQRITHCLERRTNQLDNGLTLYFATEHGRRLAVYVDINRPLENVDYELLEVFCANLSVGFDNVLLYSRLEEQAFKDPLLNIPNLNRLLQYQYTLEDTASAPMLALIDIDDFSAFNDSFGHRSGDRLLQSVADKLSEAFPRCFLARVGSDVFAIVGLNHDVTSQRIADVFDQSFLVDDQPFKIFASTGLVRLGDSSTDLAHRYKDAQVALKQAKIHHRGAAITFSIEMGQDARDRMLLLTELKEALDDKGLFLMYQPKYRLNSMELSGVEALLRWSNKQGSLVPPDQFIPLAEQSGMMARIGEFVLQRACEEFHQLIESGYNNITMAINVSPAQFDEPNFTDQLQQAITINAIPAHQIELEITETIAAKDLPYLSRMLEQVRELGCKVAIDDFGTGFSSLNVLHKLPATRLKIDRTFVDAMEHDCTIAKMIVNLGQTLGMEITAEGIETTFQLEKLKKFQCEEGQGWLFAKAMRMEELIHFITNEKDT
ncbi:EAL domain-containing protein [Vibrio europaeus]|uniref:EAL domain-containing response regulator n=1 Tax=Vibrio europaeus TaxID=300876 RepID=UPI0018A7AFB2|nr:EAL domain-containing protein [Vibrio europaeus]MDC5811454.1 EAL domain-containing protein [Vibrio europaeus]QPG34608.1 EAL domain-containing protein [Vibrio europaeus]